MLKEDKGNAMDELIRSVVKKQEGAGNGTKEALPQRKHAKDADLQELLKKKKASVFIVGCGGAGNNTISRLMQVGVDGAKSIAINTDAQDLLYTDADEKILIGKEITEGLGAGANPKVGEAAAKESKDEIKASLQGGDLVFITCGLGGGTGTGSAPVVAEVARKENALTVGIVTLPFHMEGSHRMANARMGLEKLEELVDTLIVIPNEKLIEIVPDVSINTAFKVADEILVNAVKGITKLITKPGLINLDFADIKAIMGNGGIAMVGMGESDTENRGYEAGHKARPYPHLVMDIACATCALINVTGGLDLTLKEAKEIVTSVTSQLAPDAKVIWGAMIQRELGDMIRVLLIVTGVKNYTVGLPPETGHTAPELKDGIEKDLGIEFI